MDDRTTLLRRGLLALAAISVVGTALDLASLRHWTSWTQRIPWAVLAALVVAIVLAAIGQPRALVIARGIAVIALMCAVFGVYEHIKSNYDVAPLDFRYTDRWPTMSAWSKWWAAANMSVGPAPPIAPAALAYSSLSVILATLRHPAVRGRPVEDGVTD